VQLLTYSRTVLQVTAWIPLLDVDAENGCMQLLRGGHLPGKTVAHTGASGNTWWVAGHSAALHECAALHAGDGKSACFAASVLHTVLHRRMTHHACGKPATAYVHAML
jgi:hypothetical protein